MSQKVGPFGGRNGNAFDDGVYDVVRKIIVGENEYGVSYIKTEYEKDGKIVTKEHGDNTTNTLKEFQLNYPDEYITSIQGTHSTVVRFATVIVKTLIFKTSHGRTSPMFGKTSNVKTDFEVEGKDGAKLIGFHGRAGALIESIGAYFSVGGSSSPSKKLEAKGGNGGDAWDDGVYDDVRKVYVGQGDSGVSFVKFEYANGKQLVVGDGHGKMSLLGTEEFEIDFPNEYIISVEGSYDKVYGIAAEVVAMLRFKTNKRTSPPFGLNAGESFVLEEKDHKIVGFHGKAGEFVHQVGVYVSPISKS